MNAAQVLDHFHRICDAPDAIPRLRHFIFDLAARGKLAEQNPNDEPASELLKRIQMEKERLVKEGMVRKQDALRPFDERLTPFAVPKHWMWLPLNEVGVISGGMTPSKDRPDFWDGDIDWFSPKDVKTDELVESELKITSAGVVETGLQVYRPGCLFMVARSGILKRTFPVAINRVEATANQDLKVLTPFIRELERYLQIMFRGMTDFILSTLVKTGTTVQSLKYEEFEIQPIPLPPLAEQQRIVTKVDELMVLCDRLEAAQAQRESRRDRLAAASLHRLNNGADADEFREHTRFHLRHLPRLTTRPEHIQQLRQTILNLAVRGKLVPQDSNDEPVAQVIERIQADKALAVTAGNYKSEKPLDPIKTEEVPFALPRGWEWRKIDSLVRSLGRDIRTGPFGSSLHKEEHRLKGVPVWGIESINKKGFFTGSNKIFVDPQKALELAPFAVKGGDIIISRSGTVGELCRVPDDAPYGLLSTNLMKISLDREIVVADYFYFLFKGTKSIDAQLSALCSGSTRLFLTQSILAKLLFPLPPVAEQRRIVAKVDELMVLCDRLEAQLAKIQTTSRRYLEAVLHDVVSGLLDRGVSPWLTERNAHCVVGTPASHS